jgi:hypothetical protein
LKELERINAITIILLRTWHGGMGVGVGVGVGGAGRGEEEEEESSGIGGIRERRKSHLDEIRGHWNNTSLVTCLVTGAIQVPPAPRILSSIGSGPEGSHRGNNDYAAML